MKNGPLQALLRQTHPQASRGLATARQRKHSKTNPCFGCRKTKSPCAALKCGSQVVCVQIKGSWRNAGCRALWWDSEGKAGDLGFKPASWASWWAWSANPTPRPPGPDVTSLWKRWGLESSWDLTTWAVGTLLSFTIQRHIQLDMRSGSAFEVWTVLPRSVCSPWDGRVSRLGGTPGWESLSWPIPKAPSAVQQTQPWPWQSTCTAVSLHLLVSTGRVSETLFGWFPDVRPTGGHSFWRCLSCNREMKCHWSGVLMVWWVGCGGLDSLGPLCFSAAVCGGWEPGKVWMGENAEGTRPTLALWGLYSLPPGPGVLLTTRFGHRRSCYLEAWLKRPEVAHTHGSCSSQECISSETHGVSLTPSRPLRHREEITPKPAINDQHSFLSHSHPFRCTWSKLAVWREPHHKWGAAEARRPQLSSRLRGVSSTWGWVRPSWSGKEATPTAAGW